MSWLGSPVCSVNQHTGDGIMALFGAPMAHEDHAQRACYAALHLRTSREIAPNDGALVDKLRQDELDDPFPVSQGRPVHILKTLDERSRAYP